MVLSSNYLYVSKSQAKKQHHIVIGDPLGKGGFGYVYNVEDEDEEGNVRNLALKVSKKKQDLEGSDRVREKAWDNIVRETNFFFYRTNLVKVEDSWLSPEGDQAFVLMEKCEGNSFELGQPLPPETCMDLGIDVAKGLQHLHKKNFVHS